MSFIHYLVLEKTLESSLNCKEIQPVHSKGDQSWVFTGRTDAKAETPILWPPHAKGWLIGKDSDAGRDWGQEEKGTTEDEMAGWHHWLDRFEFEWTLGVGDGQGSLACCDSWGRKESDTTEWLNWTELKICLNHLFLFTFCVWLLDSLKLHTQHAVYLRYFFWTVLLQSFPVRSVWVRAPARTTLPWILLLCPSSQCSSPGNTPSLCHGNRTPISGSPRSQT